METQINELYPILPEWERTAPPSAPPLDGGQSYRLQKLMRSKEFSKMNVKNVIILAKNIIKQLKSSVI